MQEPKLIYPKSEFIAYLQKQINEGMEISEYIQKFPNATEKIRRDTELWNHINHDYLESAFDITPNKYTLSYKSSDEIYLVKSLLSADRLVCWRLISDMISILEGLIKRAEHIKEVESISTKSKIEAKVGTINKKIFIVHGHEELILNQVARCLVKLELDPIILKEQANSGLTIIEKFEKESDVGFAVVLLTDDDLGKNKKDIDFKKRARQNVILELGYFMGKLGRNKVMTLSAEGVEKPSDIDGLLYCLIDAAGAWRLNLAHELKAAGFSIDFSKLL